MRSGLITVKGYSHCAKPAAWRQAHGHFHASVSSAWAPESSKCLQTGKKWSFQGPRKNIPSGRSCEHCDSQNCSSLCGRCAAAFRAAWQKFASYNGNNPRNLLTKPVGFTANNRFHKHFWICWTIWLWNESLQAVCWVHVGCHVGPAPELRLLLLFRSVECCIARLASRLKEIRQLRWVGIHPPWQPQHFGIQNSINLHCQARVFPLHRPSSPCVSRDAQSTWNSTEQVVLQMAALERSIERFGWKSQPCRWSLWNVGGARISHLITHAWMGTDAQ